MVKSQSGSPPGGYCCCCTVDRHRDINYLLVGVYRTLRLAFSFLFIYAAYIALVFVLDARYNKARPRAGSSGAPSAPASDEASAPLLDTAATPPPARLPSERPEDVARVQTPLERRRSKLERQQSRRSTGQSSPAPPSDGHGLDRSAGDGMGYGTLGSTATGGSSEGLHTSDSLDSVGTGTSVRVVHVTNAADEMGMWLRAGSVDLRPAMRCSVILTHIRPMCGVLTAGGRAQGPGALTAVTEHRTNDGDGSSDASDDELDDRVELLSWPADEPWWGKLTCIAQYPFSVLRW